VTHTLKPKAYLRYGDDFLLFETDKDSLEKMRERTTVFLREKLSLTINSKNDIIVKPRQGIYFLGVDIFPNGRRLKKRNWKKILINLSARNFSSYLGLVKKHSKRKKIKEINWRIHCISDENMP
jgi:alanine-alpha-ketoisovalerate/valine-pyruvate aminotransferase